MILTELKQKYVIALNLMTRSEQTKKSYLSALNKFIKERTRVYRLNENDLKLYMSDFRNVYSDSYYNVMGSALRLLYVEVLGQKQKMNWFKPIKTERKFHNIVSQDMFISMMKNAGNLKHKTIIILLYSTGIRESELINLKIQDINFTEKRLFIRSVKKGKNRFIPLHDLTIRYLQKYLIKYNPTEYMLNGQKSLKYSASSIRNVCKNNSNGKVYPHLMRHTYLTNVIEKEDVFAAMELAGHKSLKSTLHYNHISPDREIFNPLDKINVLQHT